MHAEFFHMGKAECLWMSSSDLEIAYKAHSKSEQDHFHLLKKLSFEHLKKT